MLKRPRPPHRLPGSSGRLGLALLMGLWLGGQGSQLDPLADFRGRPFEIEGTYVYSCACNTVCPCMFGSEGTTDNCQFPLVLRVVSGHVGEVRLDGMTLMMVNLWGGKDLVGELKAGRARAAIYIDAAGTHQQQRALLAAYLTVRKTKYAELKGPFLVSFQFQVEGDQAEVKVPGKLDLQVRRLRHQGKYIEISNVPYHITDHVFAGFAPRHHFDDAEVGASWNFDGRNGDFGSFRLSGSVSEERITWF